MFDKEKIVEIIEEVIGIKINDLTINPFEHGLNSLGVLKLVTFIENRLNIEVDDNDLTIDNMSSINSIIKMVEKNDD